MKNKVSEITDIRLGIFCKPEQNGNTRYLQAIDYTNDGELIPATEMTPMILSNYNPYSHTLKSGDILLSVKGDKNYAVVFQPESYSCVASTSFIVITIKDIYKTKIIPEYICWYMNNPETLKQLKISSKGSNIHSISKVEIQNLEIVIPSLEKQLLIANIDTLLKEERITQNRLIQLKKLLLIHSIKH